jgi:hypothetical protein
MPNVKFKLTIGKKIQKSEERGNAENSEGISIKPKREVFFSQEKIGTKWIKKKPKRYFFRIYFKMWR